MKLSAYEIMRKAQLRPEFINAVCGYHKSYRKGLLSYADVEKYVIQDMCEVFCEQLAEEE